jgi:TetR/AcrR family transcriptional regulator, transcriptional repressor for nem operon
MVTPKGAATKRRILDSTVDVLISRGRQAANLDDILAATQTSKSQLFHYFPGGKQDLLHAAAAQHVQRLSGADPDELDSWDRWQRWVDGVLARHRAQTADDACEVAALAGGVLGADEVEQPLYRGAFEAWHARLAAGVAALRDRRLVRPETDPDAVAALFAAALAGGAVIDKALGTPQHLEWALRSAYAYLRSLAADDQGQVR